MKFYECWFPNCQYSTNSRSKIDYHHVIPRELDPSPRNKMTIPLCKTHHALIYVPESCSGQHSIRTLDSLIIKGIYDSTVGKAILYENMNGEEFYYTPKDKGILG